MWRSRSGFTAPRSHGRPGQLVRCYVLVPGVFGGERRARGEFVFVGEREAWDLHARRLVTVDTEVEHAAVTAAEEHVRGRPQFVPSFRPDMPL